MPEKKYLIEIPGQEGVAYWGEERYNANKDALLKDHPNAIIAEIGTYSAEDANDSDMYLIDVPGQEGTAYWDSARFKANQESLLKDFPNARIQRLRGVDYWGEQKADLERRMDEHNAQYGEFLRDYEGKQQDERNVRLGTGGKVRSMYSDYLFDNASEYATRNKEREALRSEYYNNPSVKAEREGDLIAIKDMSAKLQEEADNKYKEAIANYQAEGGNIAARGADKVISEKAETQMYTSAINMLQKAQETLEAPSKYDESNGFVNFMKGAGNTFGSADFWSAGLTEIQDNVKARTAFDRLKEELGTTDISKLNEEQIDKALSPAEKAMVLAFTRKALADYKRAEDMSLGYQSGKSAAESLGFMAQFLLTGSVTNAAAKGATSGMAKWLAKNLGNAFVKQAGSTAARFGAKAIQQAGKFALGTTRSLVDAAVRTGMTTTLARSISEQALPNIYEGTLPQANEYVLKGLGDAFIENWSEAYGGVLSKMVSAPASALFGKWGQVIARSPMMKGLERAGFNGYLSEIGEEWFGNAMRTLTKVNPDALKDFATVDSQIVTATSFLPMSLIGGGVSIGQYKFAGKDLENKAAELRVALQNAGLNMEEIDALVDYTQQLSPRMLSERFTPIINRLARSSNGNAASVMRTATNFAKAVARYQAVEGGYQAEENNAKNEYRDQLQQQMNGEQFWTTRELNASNEQGGAYTEDEVRVATLLDGSRVFILGQEGDQIQYLDEQGNHNFMSESDMPAVVAEERTMSLDQFLSEDVIARRREQEALRMAEERAVQIHDIKAAHPIGSVVNLGTRVNPMEGVIVGYQAGYAMVQTSNQEVKAVSYDELAQAYNTPIRVLTDEQVASEEAAILESQNAEMETEQAETSEEMDGADLSVESAVELEEEAAPTNIPMNEDGTVNEEKFLEDNPEAYVEWNDAERQDGGADSIEQLQMLVPVYQAQYNQAAKEWAANAANPVARRAAKNAMAEWQDKMNRIQNLLAKYTSPAEQEETSTADRTIQLELEDLHDGTLNEAEIASNIDAHIAEAQNALNEYAKNAPEMGTDRKAYRQAKAEYEEGLTSLQQELDYWNAVKAANEKYGQVVSSEELDRLEAERVAVLKDRVNEWQEKLGVEIETIERVEDIDDPEALADMANGGKPMGWTNIKTGKVVLVLPHNDSIQMIDETIVHEVVSHKGLRGLLGQKDFDKLCDRVFKGMSQEDKQFYRNYANVNGDSRKAADEYIAHLAEKVDVLNDSEISTWRKIVDFVKDALRAIGISISYSDQELSDLIKRSYVRLNENAQSESVEELEENGFEVDQENGDVRFSSRYTTTPQDAEALVRDIVNVTGRDEKTAERWLQSEQSAAALVLADKEYLDYVPDDRYEAIKDNSDYPQGTVDFNNICRKRVSFTKMFTRLQRRFPNRVFSADDLADIRTIMSNDGLTVACGLCYVEDRRQMIGEVAAFFIDQMQKDFVDYTYGVSAKDFVAGKMKRKKSQNKSKVKKAAKYKAIIGGDTYVPKVYDLTTLEGLDKLYREHRGIWEAYQAFNNDRGQQSQNLFQGYAEYKREILGWSKAKVKKVNSLGGLRVFSYSDFEAHHLLDLIQIIIDCAAKGVMIQGYTKVPEFARAVANTGIKLNRSLIPLGDTGIVDGQLAFDPIEGIDINDPNFLESNDNIGNILIGINDEQIRLAMVDPFIHYIIPYHARQAEGIRAKLKVGKWVNYIDTQNERNAKTGKRVDDNINIYTEVLNESITNDREFVERYLEVCKEKGYIPKFDQFLNRDADGNYTYTPGYYKFLVDFKLFDENGNILPQKPVVAEFDDAFNAEILEKYVADERETTGNQMNATYEKIVDALGLNEEEAEGENLMFSTSNNNQAIFVSNAAKAVEGIKMEKATPEQWLKMIEKNGGLKAGEDKWMGLSDWLKASDKKTLTKQEVLDFIDEHMIVIEETHYDAYAEERASDAHSNIVGVLQNKFNDYVAEYHEEHGYEDEYDDPASKYAIEKLREEMEDTFPYTIELVYGNEVYVTFDYEEEDEMVKWAEKTGVDYIPGENPINSTRLNYTTDGLNNKHEIALTIPTIDPYQTDDVHFTDAGDGRAVAWIRFGETKKLLGTTEVDGKKKFNWAKVLVIDEIQSKRHQDAREKNPGTNQPRGYRNDAKIAELRAKENALMDEKVELTKEILHKFGVIHYLETGGPGKFDPELQEKAEMGKVGSQEQMARMKELDAEISATIDERYALTTGIPDAPFDKNWHELAMKRMLRYAAENGYDVVAWTKGEQQAERYNMESAISAVYASKDGEKYYVEVYDKDGEEVTFNGLVGDSRSSGSYTVDELKQHFGAEAAKVIMESAEALPPENEVEALRKKAGETRKKEDIEAWRNARSARIDGDKLFRGEGMKSFYDKMLPAFMNKYGKKWGIKVEDIHLYLEGGLDMHSIPVTEEMKESVMEGQTMFSTRRADEKPSEFLGRMIPEFENTYNVKVPATIVKGTSKKRFAEAIGVDEQEISNDVYMDFLKVWEESGGAHLIIENNGNVTERILIFAQKIYKAWYEVDNALFHENIHGFALDKPEVYELGQWLFEAETEDKHILNIRNYVREIYSEGEYHKEMLTNYVATMMAVGYSRVAMNSIPEEYKPLLNYIYERFGYNPETEDRIRRERYIDSQKSNGELQKRNTTNGEDSPQSSETLFSTRISPEARREMDVISAQAIVNGNYMKAPNGKDSKLTPEQWALVRTQNFINWFGDWINDPENASKVVDENGEPMVVYHGTAGVINEFEDQQRSPGFWFVDREDVANGYAESASAEFGKEKNIIPVFLNLRNPRIEDSHAEYPAEFALKSYVENDKGVYEVFDTYEEAEAYREANVPDAWVGAAEVGDQHDLVERAKELGNDGVIMLDMHDQAAYAETRVEGTQTNYVVLDANQIKSATDNTGEFSESEDIRFSTRTAPAPTKTQDVYKLMRLGSDGRLYPLFIGSAEPIELGTWYDAESPNLGDLTKLASGVHLVNNETGEAMTLDEFKAQHPEIAIKGKRPNVAAINWATENGARWIEIEDKATAQRRYEGESRSYYNLGINGSGQVGQFAMRPGWHAGSLPTMRQIGKGKNKNLRDDSFVWVKGRIPADVDYQSEADANPDKDIPTHIPTDGFYMKATNANKKASQADKMGWYVAGSFIADEIMSDAEARSVIDSWNAEHPDAQVEYDYPRESGREYDPKRGGLVEAEEENLSDLTKPEETTTFKTTGTPTEQVVNDGLVLSLEDFTNLAADIFKSLPEDVRKQIVANASRRGYDLKKATFQLSTSLAEKKNLSEEEIELAKLIAQKVEDAVIASGVEMTRPLTTNEALWMLYQSTNPTSEYDVIGNARKAVVADNLGFSKDAQSQEKRDESEVMFRRTYVPEQAVSAADAYTQAISYYGNRLNEAFVDQFDAVDHLMKAIEDATGKKAETWEDIRLVLNQSASKGLAKLKEVERDLIQKMWDAVNELAKAGVTQERLARYVILKHGLERNEAFAARDARNFYEAEYRDELKRIKNDSTLTDAEKDQRRDDAKKVLDDHLLDIQNKVDDKYLENRKTDYSGIKAMFADYPGLMSEDNYSTAEEYKTAKRKARVLKYKKLSDAEAQAEMECDAFEVGKDNLIKGLWSSINNLTRGTLKMQYEYGMLSKDAYQSLTSMFNYYVPLRGFADNTGEDLYDYYGHNVSDGYAPAVMGAKGRKSEAESPFGWMAAMAATAVVSGEKNLAKQALYWFAVNRKANDLLKVADVWYVESQSEPGKFYPEYPPKADPNKTPAENAQQYTDWEQQMEDLAKQGKAVKKANRLSVEGVANFGRLDAPEHVIKVNIAGEEKQLIVNANPRAAQAINGLLNIETNPDYQKVLGKVLRWMSQVSTGWNPEFWMTNISRDTITAFSAIHIKEDKAYNEAFRRNWADAWKIVKLLPKLKDGSLGNGRLEDLLREAVENGVQTGYSHIKAMEEWDKEMGQYLKDLNKDEKAIVRGTKNFIDKIQNLSESMELVSRFATYITSREMGRDIIQSVSDAKEVTVNFNRKGSGMRITFDEAKKLKWADGKPIFSEKWTGLRRQMGLASVAYVSGISALAPFGRKFMMFFNAGIQGLNMWLQLIRQGYGKQIGTMAGAAFALGILNSVVAGMLDGDDDDYQQSISDYERRTNLMLGANGYYLKIALPQELRGFYGLGDILYNYMAGNYHHKDKPMEIIRAVSGQLFEMLPINPMGGWQEFIPQIGKATVEAGLAIPFFGEVIKGTNMNFAGIPLRDEKPWLSEDEKQSLPKYTFAGEGTWNWLVRTAELANKVTGGTEYDAGWLQLDPARIQHYVEQATGGIGGFVGKILSTIDATMDPETEVEVAKIPFLNKVFTVADERGQNKLINQQYYYYKGVAERSEMRLNKYHGAKDRENVKEEKNSKDYKIAKVFRKYEVRQESYTERMKRARSSEEEKELKMKRDANRKEFLNELEEKGLL